MYKYRKFYLQNGLSEFSQDLFPFVQSFSVHNPTELTHHSFLSVVMRIEIPQELKDIMRLSNHPGHMIWNENKKEKLQNIMLSEEVKHKLDSLFYPDKTANCSVDINKLVLVIFHKSCKIQARIFYSQKNKENMQIKTQSEGKSGIMKVAMH